MKALSEILAKSKDYGGTTLLEHTQHVLLAIEVFAQKYAFSFDVEMARKGAVLHDLGKAHPHFQRKIQKINGKSLSDERNWNFIHRHELSSLGFLPVFPEDEWPILIDLVVAHHKSMEKDAGEKGILDLDERFSDWKEKHLMDWENWSVYGLQILQNFGYAITINKIPIDEAKSALEYAVEYCEEKKTGWSPWRGLLKSADHFASAFTEETCEKLRRLFETPELSFYHGKDRKKELYPLSVTAADDLRPHTLVVAPTGAGKTDFLLRRCQGRIFYTLPFQASINAMYQRFRSTIPTHDIRLLHATSKIVERNRKDEQILQPLAGSALKVMTPHQLAAIIFGTSGFESMMLDVQRSDIILDEIHTYSDYAQAMVIEIVKALLRLDCRLHIGTATMPSVLYKKLLEILGGNEKVYEVSLPEHTLVSFNRHRVYKMEDESSIFDLLKNAFAQKEKVLLIYNTVKGAQTAFRELSENKDFIHIPKMLIHSRFRRGDRVRLEKELTEVYNVQKGPCLVISTQVVEVSLDISFDRMITQCAPLDALIQRFGRINRVRNESTIGNYKPVHVIAPAENALPYKMEIIKDSFIQLPDNGEILHEKDLQAKIDEVYPKLDMKAIDVHLIYREGKYNLTELCDHSKAVLVDALEIESATCILESDREKYLAAKWEDRLPLEIPINYKSLQKYRKEYEQLEVGSYPYVVPQPLEEYEMLGLQLLEHQNII